MVYINLYDFYRGELTQVLQEGVMGLKGVSAHGGFMKYFLIAKIVYSLGLYFRKVDNTPF